MKMGRLARTFAYAVVVLAISGSECALSAQSHDVRGDATASTLHGHNQHGGALVKEVRNATRQFIDVAEAIGKGFVLRFGCVSGGDFGAMGLHFVNFGRVFDGGALKVEEPEIVLYEPTRDGGVRITGADYLVLAADWDATHDEPPQLMGQLFHLFESPNRFGLDPFYTLHVWAWKGNPAGTFSNWNPDVSCDAFNPPPPPER